ncbi:MAG: hypothetical protein BZ138_03285 [Methanosphaera sp. rholeuAM270]|nr:MAG: hypothetical protein BZ138_03285 [Methanosphaera sp. rholeuAM270]
MDAKAQIEEDQRKYQEDRSFFNMLSELLCGVFGLFMILPLAIYGLFGREPKISYDAEYEYDLPTDSTPIEVNYIVVGNAGDLDNNSIYATILDLINRKYFEVMASTDDDTILRQTNQDTSTLKSFEKSLINYLKKFELNGDISLKSIADTGNPQDFTNFKDSWTASASKEVPNSLLKRYFDDKGSNIFNVLSLIIFVLGILLLIIYAFIDFPPKLFLIIPTIAILLLAEGIIMMGIPNTFAGRWTPEGKEYHDKWKSFENYLKDFSLIKERPPASIQVWGKYLVYAAALGCADEVTKNMKEYFDLVAVSDDYYHNSHAVLFAYYGGFNHLDSTFTALTPSSSDSGGIGGVGGGGFGGGGGGTF